MRRASWTLLFWVTCISKNSDTLEIAGHSLLNTPVIIRRRFGFHFRSTDLAEKKNIHRNFGSICKQTCDRAI